MTVERLDEIEATEELLDSMLPGVAVLDHAKVIEDVRTLVAANRLATPVAWRTIRHLVIEWGIAAGAAVIGLAVNEIAVWVLVWIVMAWVLAGNAAIMHEGAHGHLFRSKRANRVLGTVAIAMLFGSFASYRAYHLEHHAKTAQEGDPEGTPLSMRSRWLYAALLLVGGLAVLVENTVYSVTTVIGHPPRWARSVKHRRAIRLNAAVVALFIGAAVWSMLVAPRITLEVWLIPAGAAAFILLPLLLLPEHYGAAGAGDILDNTRSVQSNPLLRWFFWNTNYHAAHHLAPGVPFYAIDAVEDLLASGPLARVWRTRSYTQFHVGNLTRLAFSRQPR